MIDKPYILFTRIPLIRNLAGRVFCDPLWEKDLKLHVGYIEDFGICCPIELREDIKGQKDITDLGIRRYFDLKTDYGLKSVLSNFLPNFAVVIKACRNAKIVHSGGAGWAFPLSFYLLFLKPIFQFQWIIVIESSPWMLERDEKRTPRKTIEHYLHKVLLTFCVRAADARIFTQSFYRRYFLGKTVDRTFINPATWIDEEIITTPESVRNRFKARSDNILKILFPSRLVKDKGVFVVFDALEKLAASTQNIHITIMGSGELTQQCQYFVDTYQGNVDLVFKKPVAYGNEFFELLAQYDFVLVATLKQEQPRIVFDAFSQGVPVIGSDTPGIQDITNKDNAVTFKRGDSASLAEAICSMSHGVALDMGLAGLDYVRGKTHLQMHEDREKFLRSVL